MLATTNLTPRVTPLEERLELANRLFREFHTLCFWHSPLDLVITEDLVPFVVKGLRKDGGRRGFIVAAQLQPKGAANPTSDREPFECR